MRTPIRGARLIASLLLFLCLTLPGLGSVMPLLRLTTLHAAKAKAFAVADNSGTITAANANGNTGTATTGSFVTVTLIAGANLVTIDVRGTYAGTLSVQTTLDGTNWTTVPNSLVTSVGTIGTTGISANATGTWTVPASGRALRVVGVPWSSGAATVTLSSGAGGSFAMMRAGPNTWTGAQTFNGLVTFGGGAAFQSPAYFLGQNLTLDGSTKTIDPSLGVDIAVTGSTAGTTIKLPAPAAAIDGLILRLLYGGGATYTLDANGSTIYDGGTTQTTQAVSTSRTMVYYHGLGWLPEGLTRVAANVYFGQLAAANSWTGTNAFPGGTTWGVKLVTGNTTLAATDPNVVDVNGSGLTVTLEPSPTAGRFIFLRNTSGNSFALAGNGKNVDGSSAITVPTNIGIGVYFNGTAWYSFTPDTGYNLSVSGIWTFSNGVTSNSTLTVGGRTVVTPASISTTGGTTSALSSNVSLAVITGSTAGTTVPLSATPTTNQTITIENQASVSVSISGNGSNIVNKGSSSGSYTLAANTTMVVRYTGSVYWIQSVY